MMPTSRQRSLVLIAACIVAACDAGVSRPSEIGTDEQGPISAVLPVKHVSISVEDSALIVGQSTNIDAAAIGPNGQRLTDRIVTWTSSDATVLSIVPTSGGKATAQGGVAGTSILTATCEGKSATIAVTVRSRPVANVTAGLAAAAITMAQTTHAYALTVDSLGNPLTGRTVVWSSLNPEVATVSSSGVVTPVALGTAVIRAMVESKTGDATLLVNSTSTPTTPTTPGTPGTPSGPGTPGQTAAASVSVSVDSISITAGHKAHATAVAKDANGNILTGKVPSWKSQSTSIATVDQNGVVSGVSAGLTQVQATIDGISGAASLTVTVPAVITPPPTTTPPVTGSNQPSGLSLLRSWSGDTLTTSQWYPSHPTNPSIVVDPSSPDGSTNVGQIKFPAGFGSGSAPAGLWLVAPFAQKPKQVYVSFWIKLSENWVGNAAGANKIGYMNVDGRGRGSFEFLAMGGLDGSQQTLAPMIVLEGVTVADGPGASGSPSVALTANMQPYSASIAYQRGTWGHYEILMTLNSAPGVTDGSIKWWWNGQLYGDYTNRVDWSITSSSAFSDVYWEPTYGGAGPAVPVDQYMWLKSLFISGR